MDISYITSVIASSNTIQYLCDFIYITKLHPKFLVIYVPTVSMYIYVSISKYVTNAHFTTSLLTFSIIILF